MAPSSYQYQTFSGEAMSSDGKQDAVASADAQEDAQSRQPSRGIFSNVARKIWGDDPRERKYIQKLDSFLFNAFVSGMQEELGLYGNERNLLNTYFNIGIILGTIPAQMIQLKWVRPSIWIPACELAWSALTMVMASAKNVETTEGVISIPIALYGFFALPDLPHNTRAFYLKKGDREYGLERTKKMGRKPPSKLTFKAIKDIYTSWQLWAFILPYLMVAEAGSGTGYFNLYLKSEGYSVVQTNVLPTIGNAIQIVAAFSVGWLSDATGNRVLTVVFVQVLVLVSNIILSIWNVPKAALLAAFYLSYTGGAAQPVVISYGHEITQWNANLRQLLVATGNIFTYTFSAWMPVVLFPTYDAPKYKYGYQILILFGGLAVIGMYLLDHLYKRDLKRNPHLYELDDETVGDNDSQNEDVADGLRP
ncbi:Pantothenate transporter liz1 [Colletotrichum sp. SAR 10_66]|nr:Pantothenate transporter liz1 [Colletotrichum sp. SAR 10_66]